MFIKNKRNQFKLMSGFIQTLSIRKQNCMRVFCKNIKKNRINLVSGFTLVEVIVTISIVSVIMMVILFNYGAFVDKLALTSAGQEMAVVIRQAQTYGLSVKEVSASPGNFDSAYGFYVNLNEPVNYYLFADAYPPNEPPTSVPNELYDSLSGCGTGVSTECIEKFTLRNGIRIISICNRTTCTPTTSFNAMHITFLRPNPDAVINLTGPDPTELSLQGRIIMESPKGLQLTVTIESTGQVLVQ